MQQGPTDLDFLPENGRPAESEYHANYYQRSDLFLKGVAIQGAEHNELVEPFETPLPLKHVTVDDVETIVKTDLRLRLWDRLPVP